MLNIELSAFAVRASRFEDAYLFAHFQNDDDFRSTEFTSDYLGYFGFGAGMPRRASTTAPDWAYQLQFFEFPSLNGEKEHLSHLPDDELQATVLANQIRRMYNLLDWYRRQHNILIDIGDIRAFVDLLGDYMSHEFSYDFLDTVMEGFNGHVRSNRPKYEHRTGAVAMHVSKDGNSYLMLAGPKVDTSSLPELGVRPVDLTGDYSIFKWEHVSQLGSVQNVMSILKSMRPHKFTTKDKDEQDKMIDNIHHQLSLIRHF